MRQVDADVERCGQSKVGVFARRWVYAGGQFNDLLVVTGMDGISDLYISGIDEERPPIIRKEPYIDLHFKFNHKAPEQWCDDLNRLIPKPSKVDPKQGLYVDTWVRKIEDIEPLFELLRKAVQLCTKNYIARAEEERLAAIAAGKAPADEGEQGRLNKVIAHLDYKPL